MMTKKTDSPTYWLPFAAALLVLSPVAPLCAQSSTTGAAPAKSPAAPASMAAATKAATPASTVQAPNTTPNRSQAYYHLALAATYEDDALSEGRPEDVTHAVEEYKLALNADPNSPELNDALADLYFRTGSVRQAESTAKNLLKTSPNDIAAHRLLGRIYLRDLGESENSGSAAAAPPSGDVLGQAIAEFEKIVALDPNSVEDRMVLGQLYTVKHEPQKAEEQFKTAQAIEPDSEDVILNLARLYAERGDMRHSVEVIEDVPESDRAANMEYTLGAAYDQLKRSKDAIAAYQRAEDMEPGDPRTIEALAE